MVTQVTTRRISATGCGAALSARVCAGLLLDGWLDLGARHVGLSRTET